MTTVATPATMTRWAAVCRLDDLIPERGAAALFGDLQVAVFRLADGTVRALGNRDPVSGAYVMSRGIVGSRGGCAVVVSPMHKQAYDLDTGVCLDVDRVNLPVFAARVRDGLVEVAIAR
jgi:nitrite reductase (NADH) small subunit